MKKSKKYVGYLCVATDKQGELGLGLADQKEIILNMMDFVDGTIVKWYEEHETATNKRIRIIQNEALAFCREHGCIFCTAFVDQFACYYDFVKSMLDNNDPYLFCDAPTATKAQIKKLAVKAENEAKKNSESTKRGLAQAKKRGQKLGSPQNMTAEARKKGNETRKLRALTDPNNRRAINLAMKFKEAKFTQTEIADILNDSGVTTSTGHKWTQKSISRLYRLYRGNEEYMKIS